MKKYRSYWLCLLMWAICLLSGSAVSHALEISKPTVWQGTMEVVDKVRIQTGASLTIKPGTKVVFKGEGSIFIQGKLQAEGVTFVAQGILDKFPRIKSFMATIVLEKCSFKNIVSTHVKYQNPGIQFTYGKVVIRDCVFEHGSAIDLVLIVDAVFEKNRILDPVSGYGVVLRQCREAIVSGNTFHSQGQQRRTKLLWIAGKRAMKNQITANRFFGGAMTTSIEFTQLARNNIIKRNLIADGAKGIVIGSASTGNSIIQNAIMDCYSGIVFKHSGANNVIQNCVIWNAKAASVSVTSPFEVTIMNTVLSGGKYGLFLGKDSGSVVLKHNLFWNTKKDFAKEDMRIKHSANIHAAPLFVDADNGNFKPQAKQSGYGVDSPLLGVGSKNNNIGLYP
ncbi:MAG: right-handed parallel beta-helix repeat-containing protein [Victivallaceae bacterium]|nr:right-handed parallel beta-helix repeat-containing protein [Victivallaceae bacterium]